MTKVMKLLIKKNKTRDSQFTSDRTTGLELKCIKSQLWQADVTGVQVSAIFSFQIENQNHYQMGNLLRLDELYVRYESIFIIKHSVSPSL